MGETLGERLLVGGLSIKGDMHIRMAQHLLRHIMAAIGVSPVHEQVFYAYPVDGKGGKGFTLIQPITESFIALDAWPDHGGAYLVIASCKYFAVADVVRVIQDAGLQVTGLWNEALSLKYDQPV